MNVAYEDVAFRGQTASAAALLQGTNNVFWSSSKVERFTNSNLSLNGRQNGNYKSKIQQASQYSCTIKADQWPPKLNTTGTWDLVPYSQTSLEWIMGYLQSQAVVVSKGTAVGHIWMRLWNRTVCLNIFSDERQTSNRRPTDHVRVCPLDWVGPVRVQTQLKKLIKLKNSEAKMSEQQTWILKQNQY